MTTNICQSEAANSAPDSQPRGEHGFRIVWTLGFAGKRRLPDAERARTALRAELQSLLAAAEKEQAQLVAVSSLAIGGDLIFAEECLRAGIPFRAILPFEAAEFLKDDFTAEDRARFEHCLGAACTVEVASIVVSSVEAKPGATEAESNTVNRENAYLDCGYRVVEHSDVVLFLWDGVRGGVGGSADAWSYAETLKKPVWCWNPQTEQDERLRWPGIAGHTREKKRLFHDRLLFDLFAANSTSPTAAAVSEDTVRQGAVRARFDRLDRFALQEQEKTKVGLQRVLTLHLIATIAAGISFTFFGGEEYPAFWLVAGLAVMVGWVKPVCAFLALRHEKALHHDRHQDLWVDARVAAELCRSALNIWALPGQPENIVDGEDFPRFRRLIRSLQTARALDQDAVAAKWTLDRACADYLDRRLKHQKIFFEGKRADAHARHRQWHMIFVAATWYVILGGTALAVAHSRFFHSHLPTWLNHTLACLLIIAPFLATYALAIQTIHDTRRRRTRYEAMARYLQKQIEGIERSRSSVARLRLIATAERRLIEELHEWHSVTRHVAI